MLALAILPSVLLVVLGLDLLLLAPLPMLLIWQGRPGSAFAAAMITLAGVVIDGSVNFDWISWPRRFPFDLLAAPSETLPISIPVLLAINVVACRRWARTW